MSNTLQRDRPPACIHIGLPKAASTTLQQHLFANHSEIDFLGQNRPILYRTPMIREIVRKLSIRQSDQTLDEWERSVEEVRRAGSKTSLAKGVNTLKGSGGSR